MDYFTIEEINLLCIYDTASRESLLADLNQALPDIYDPEMRDIFRSAITKLDAMTDTEYEEAAPDLIFTDEESEE